MRAGALSAATASRAGSTSAGSRPIQTGHREQFLMEAVIDRTNHAWALHLRGCGPYC
jgi:hypothetical protein